MIIPNNCPICDLPLNTFYGKIILMQSVNVIITMLDLMSTLLNFMNHFTLLSII